MKKLLLLTALVSVIASADLKAEEAGAPIGVTVGGTYSSLYLFRGADWFSGNGAFLPALSYNVMGTGLILGLAAEQSEDSVLEGKEEKATGYALNSIDFGAGYTVALEPVSIGLNVWYWNYYNSKDESTSTPKSDASFVTANVTATANVFFAPFLAVTYDYYLDDNFADPVNKDFYIQVGVAQEFEVVKDAKVKLGLSGGYYNYASYVSGTIVGLDKDEISGISDITTLVGLTVAAGPVSYSTSLSYVYVPKGDLRDYGSAMNHHKFVSTFGASYTF